MKVESALSDVPLADEDAPVLQAVGLSKWYGDGPTRVHVLERVDFSLRAGERVAVVGASGAGKSTLLHILGGLDVPDSGQVLLQGENLGALPDARRTELRNQRLGFVYQFHHLLPEFTADENVAMPLIIRGRTRTEAREMAGNLLNQVGLAARRHHLPGELSGGERQRVAIARALVTHPAVLLADEPTGNLDRQTARSVFDHLIALNRTQGVAAIIVTHDPEIAARCDRTVWLKEGRLQD